MIITHQKGRGTKIHIYIDGEYTVSTDENCWYDNYISDGTDIDEAQWQELLLRINYKKALNKCADLLSRRDHSVKELRDKLLKTVDSVSADKAIKRYIEAGYLDDKRYCEALIEYLAVTKKYSIAHIKQECYKRGIDRQIVDSQLEIQDIDPVVTITELVRNKYMSKLEQDNGIEKVVASLQRKGFRYYDIKSALNRIFDDEN